MNVQKVAPDVLIENSPWICRRHPSVPAQFEKFRITIAVRYFTNLILFRYRLLMIISNKKVMTILGVRILIQLLPDLLNLVTVNLSQVWLSLDWGK